MPGKLLTEARLSLGLTREASAGQFKVGIGTLKNWERSRTKPNRRLWKTIHQLTKIEGG
jgi:DNA-binding transcriptional regulator YiaG